MCLVYGARITEGNFTTCRPPRGPANGALYEANSKSSAKVVFEPGAFRIFKSAPVISRISLARNRDSGYDFLQVSCENKMSGGVSAASFVSDFGDKGCETSSKRRWRTCFMNSLRGHISRAKACVIGVILLFQACGPQRTTSSPEEEIREGWRLYRLSEFNSAVKIFQSVQASQPKGSEFRLHALYGEASCWNHRRDGRDIAKAVAGYQAVIEEAPENPLAAWCALDMVGTRHLASADQEIRRSRSAPGRRR